ncbi:MAG: hypothetical protein ACOY5W_08970 [Pseudomonadota bacterium]
MTEYVTVRISGEERVRYDQTKKVPKDEFERLNALLNSEDRSERRKAEEVIGDLFVDRRDVLDADDFELEDFIVVADEE